MCLLKSTISTKIFIFNQVRNFKIKKEQDTHPAHKSNYYTLLIKGVIKDNTQSPLIFPEKLLSQFGLKQILRLHLKPFLLESSSMFEHNYTIPQIFSFQSYLCSSFFSHSLCKFHFYRTLPSGCFPLGIWQFENACLKNMLPRTKSNISAVPVAESTETITFLVLCSINVA